jgi:excisionase family DNA binding protein
MNTTSSTGRTELVREDEIARRLGISVNTLRRMRRRGEGPPAQPFGRLVRYRWTDVEHWLDGRAA